MNNLAASAYRFLPKPSAPPFGAARPSRRWLLAAILLFHGILFYALAHGMVHAPSMPATPREVFVSLIGAPAAKPAAPSIPTPVVEHFRQQVDVPMPQIQLAMHDSVLPAAAPTASVAPAASVASVSQAAPTSAPQVAAVATQTAAPKTLRSGISYLRAPQPQYPSLARKLGEQGTVLLRVFVNEQGHPERVDISQSSGSARLDEAARQAVLRALFKPYSEGGVAQAMFAMVPIKFATDA